MRESNKNYKAAFCNIESLDLKDLILHIQFLKKPCKFCGAFKLPHEPPGMCCSNGKVKLGPFKQPNAEIQSLFEGGDGFSKAFRKFSRFFNNDFSFSSWSKNQVPYGETQPSIKIQGLPYHLMAPLLPGIGEKHTFGQIHILDKDAQLKERELYEANSEIKGQSNYIRKLLTDFIFDNNILSKSFRLGFEILKNKPNYKLVLGNPNPNKRNHISPEVNEVAGIYDEKELKFVKNAVVISSRTGDAWKRISYYNKLYEPLSYPLIFLFGQNGWGLDFPIKKNKITLLQYVKYYLQIRDDFFNPLLLSGRILKQYQIDSKIRIDWLNLQYQVKNQDIISKNKIRRDTVENVINSDDLPNTGTGAIMSDTTPKSPRWYYNQQLNTLAIIREFGNPHLFLTMTCNPSLPEVKEMARLKIDFDVNDRPDLICRSFRERVQILIDDIMTNGIFGHATAYTGTIEFQGRGLPHIHKMIWLSNKDKIRNISDVDRLINCEIPDPVTNNKKELFRLIKSKMIHGPCGSINPKNKCMKMRNNVLECSKKFPKDFNNVTTFNDTDYYVKYRRRAPDNSGGECGISVNGKKVKITSQWIVPHSIYLLLKYQSHINLEIINKGSPAKYLTKYILKGPDRASVKVEADGTNPPKKHANDVENFLEGRYLCDMEAVWSNLGFEDRYTSPSVQVLSFHLPNQQHVSFSENDGDKEKILKNSETTLTAFFKLNKDFPLAREFLYLDICKFFTYCRISKKWKLRKQGVKDPDNFDLLRAEQISRMPVILPNGTRGMEPFALYMLLLKIKGPTSFEDLRKVGSEIFPTFKEAATALNIIEHDDELEFCLSDAFNNMDGKSYRRFAAMLFHYWTPKNILEIYEKFKDKFCEDFVRIAKKNKVLNIDLEEMYHKALRSIDFFLKAIGSSLKILGLPVPPELIEEDAPDPTNIIFNEQVDPVRVDEMYNSLNSDQKTVYDTVMDSVINRRGKFIFVNASGGTGKTYTLNSIILKCASVDKKVTACASSGIASILLKGGSTLHSRFKIPLDCLPDQPSTIKRQSKLGKQISSLDLIIWDESPMFNFSILDYLDRTLRDLKNCDKIFGGATVLLSGDWRQILPIVLGGQRADIIGATLKQSKLWKSVEILQLKINMRVSGSDSEASEFKDYLLKIGDGSANIFDSGTRTDYIKIRESFIFPGESKSDFIDYIFPDLNFKLGEADYPEWITERAIITPLNEEVDAINQIALDKLNGHEYTIYSHDENIFSVENKNMAVPVSTLNSLRSSAMPLHELKLKIGAPVTLMRNICPPDGHCNGSRYIITNITPRYITLKVTVGENKGKELTLPKIYSYDKANLLGFSFRRKQFPIRLSFAMTSNKAQGQTLKHVGIYLGQNEFFSHGQFYVAISRVTDPKNIKFFLDDIEKGTTMNVVYPEVLEI